MSVVYRLGRFRTSAEGVALRLVHLILLLTVLLCLGIQCAHAQVPAAPTNLHAIPGATRVNLYWDVTPTATSYTVYRGTASTGPWTTFTSATTSYSSTTLTNGTPYYYKVTATNASGEGPASTTGPWTPNTASAALTVTLASINGTTINLSWTTVAGATYNLYRATTSGQEGIVPLVTSITGTTYADTSLTAGTSYFYTVTAVVSGEESVQSVQVGGKPIPAPTGLTATPGNGCVTLTWGAVTGATDYKIYRGTSTGSETALVSSIGGLSYTDSGLVNGTTTYYYKVSGLVSTSAIEGVLSNEVSAVPLTTLPAAPVLTAVPGSTSIVLSWLAIASATSYKIKRSTVLGGPYTVLSSPTATTFTDSTPVANTTYYYVATALIGTTEGPNSNECAASTPSINNAPTLADSDDRQDSPSTNYGWKNVITTLALSTKVRNTYLTFDLTGASGLISSAKLKLYKASGGSDTETVYGITPSSWSENTITWSNAPALTGASIATLATTTTGQYYSFDVTSYVQAQQLAGATSVSFGLSTTSTTEVDFYSRENGANRPQLALTVGASVAPTGLTATSGQTKKVTLNWTAVPGAASYNVYRGTTAGGENGTAVATGITSTTYQNTGLADATTYFYKVSAVNANGESAKSAEASATTNSPPMITTAAAVTPSPVAGTTATLLAAASDDGGAGNLTYTWTATGTPPAAVTCSGSNGTSSGSSVTVTFTKAGSYSFLVTVADSGGLTTTSSVSVTVNQTPTTVAVSPSAATVNLGGTRTFTASGLDQFGEALTVQPSYSWTVSGGGSINASTGLFTAETAISGGGLSDGPFTVTAAAGSQSGSASVTVANGAPTVATAASASPNPVTGTTTTLSVLGADDGGEANLTYTWAATTVPTGAVPSFSANGTNAAKSSVVTFNKAGTYTFQATIKDAGGLTATSSVNVTVTAIQTSIAVTPASVVLGVSGTQTFTASAQDQFGVALSSQPTFTWSVDSSGDGTVNSGTGAYTAGTVGGTAKVRATNASLSNYGNVTVVTSVPSAPTGLTATGGNTQVSLSWTTVSTAVSYNIYRGTGSGGESTTPINTGGPVTTPSYVDSGVSNGTKYFYKVKAVNSVGSSGYSSEVNATPQLTAPTGLTATPGSGKITLSWTAVANATGYSIYRGTSGGGESGTPIATGVTGTTYANTGLNPTTHYFYKVKATNGANSSGYSNEASNYPLASVLSGVAAYPSNGRIDIRFTNETGATSYNIKRSALSGGPYTTVATLPQPAGVSPQDVVDMPVVNGTTYYYVVTAVDGGGESGNSNEAAATPIAPAPIACGQMISGTLGPSSAYAWTYGVNNPADFYTYSGVSGNSIVVSTTGVPDSIYLYSPTGSVVSWVSSVSNGNGWTNTFYLASTGNYTIEISGPNGAYTVSLACNNAPPPPANVGSTPGNAQVDVHWLGESNITSFNVKRSTTSGGPTYSPVGSVPGTATDFLDTTTANGTTYYYVVSAVGANGESVNSSETHATPEAPPSAPDPVVAKAMSTSSILLTWQNVNADNYYVERSPDGSTSWTQVASLPDFPFSYTDTGLATNTTYFYRVRGSGLIGGFGAYSAVVSTTTLLPAPMNLVATPGSQQNTLTWSAVTGATTYHVLRGTVSGGPYSVIATVTSATTYIDAANALTYYYVVTAVNAGGDSAYSNEASALANYANGSAVYRINCGGPSVSPFAADPTDPGAGVASTSDTIDISHAVGAAPVAVYQTCASRSFTYQISPLTAGTTYTVRLHFADFTYVMPGQRIFDILVNGTNVLPAFDVVAASGGKDVAVTEQFPATADSTGAITISSTAIIDTPILSGIEILTGTLQPSAPLELRAFADVTSIRLSWTAVYGATGYDIFRGSSSGGETLLTHINAGAPGYTDTGLSTGSTYYYRVCASNSAGESQYSNEAQATCTSGDAALYKINSGGLAVQDFGADEFYTGGAANSTASIIDVSGVSSPAPQAVYQDWRSGNTNYTFRNLTPFADYRVRMHFAENEGMMPGQRTFGVLCNDQMSLPEIDVALLSGGTNKAIRLDTGGIADASGAIQISFFGIMGDPIVNGIEVLSAVTQPSISSLQLQPSSVGVPGYSAAVITLNDVAPAAGTTVSLSSSDPAVSILATITVPAGAISAVVPISVTTHPASSPVTISATSGNTVTALLVAPTSGAAPLTFLTASAADAKVYLNWQLISGASTYNIYRSTTSGAETPLTSGITGTTFTDSSALNGQTYYYKVTGVVGGIETTKSNEAADMPQALLSCP